MQQITVFSKGNKLSGNFNVEVNVKEIEKESRESGTCLIVVIPHDSKREVLPVLHLKNQHPQFGGLRCNLLECK